MNFVDGKRFFVPVLPLDLHLKSSLDSGIALVRGAYSPVLPATHMSRGYTRALAMTAPVAPATAFPHGGSGAGFTGKAMVMARRAASSALVELLLM
jgi:hypothetical protein